jgi:hypothetical protein
MHYRKFYEKVLNVKLIKDFHVHHIDGNRENNEINNLLALPKDLHNKYHKCVNDYYRYCHSKKLNVKINSHNCNFAFQFEVNTMNNLHSILKECQKYLLYRNYKINKEDNLYYILGYKEELY